MAIRKGKGNSSSKKKERKKEKQHFYTRAHKDSTGGSQRAFLLMSYVPKPACSGSESRPESLSTEMRLMYS